MKTRRMLQMTLLVALTLGAIGLMADRAAAATYISVNFSSGQRIVTQPMICTQPVIVVTQPVAYGRPVMHHDYRGRDYGRGRYDYGRDRYTPAPATTTTTTTTTTAGNRGTTTTTTTTTTTATAPRPTVAAPRHTGGTGGGITIVISR